MRGYAAAGCALGLLTGCVADTAGLEALGALDVVPASIAFGTLGASCEPFVRPVTVRNESDVPVTIQEIRLRTGGPFSIAALPPPLPEETVELSPSDEVSVLVRFEAAADGLYEDVLEVRGEVAGSAFMETVSLSGRVAADGIRVDSFRQSAQADADVLFVIDNSGSMVEEQAALTRNFESFIRIADSGFLDYHIGVTTTDVSEGVDSARGRILPLEGPREERVVTRASLPTPSARFVAIGREVGAVVGSTDELGLEAMRLALGTDLLEGHNFGLIRDHAMLSVIFISDEFDQSPIADLDLYEQTLLDLKGGDRSRVTVSAVVGPLPSGCSGPNGDATESPRYTELATRLGGVIESICTSNWQEVLTRLSSTAFGLRARFPLTERPGDPDALEVRVDGRIVVRRDDLGIARWRYQAATNSVVFVSQHIPGPGAAIEIEYDTGCDGEG